MAWRIHHCRWESGERYCMMVDADTGVPPAWPTLYVTTQIRNRGHSVATMEQALRGVRVLLDFVKRTESTSKRGSSSGDSSPCTRSMPCATQPNAPSQGAQGGGSPGRSRGPTSTTA